MAAPTRPRLIRLLLPVIGLAAVLGTVTAVAAKPTGATLADVRVATAAFHDIEVALDAGYGIFYECTDNETPGVGAMGQHFANLSLVGDPAIDPLRPEVLMYEPRPGGGWRLIGMEYVVLKADWEAAFGTQVKPTVLGLPLKETPAGNRYGLPEFYQRHVWLWRNNPAGMTEDWNPKVTCRGTGDAA